VAHKENGTFPKTYEWRPTMKMRIDRPRAHNARFRRDGNFLP
jgi:hypothetical protein